MTPQIILVTASSHAEAQKIAHGLLDARLAACVNILPGIESHYWWQGKQEQATEFLLLIKSSREQFAALSEQVKALHSYDCPEIVALSPESVSTTYLQWWSQELAPHQTP